MSTTAFILAPTPTARIRAATPTFSPPLADTDLVETDLLELTQGARAWDLWNADMNQVAYSPDGAQLAISTSNGVSIYDAATLKLERAFLPNNQVEPVTWSPDGKRLAVSNFESDVIVVIDAVTGKIAQTLNNKNGSRTLAWSPDGRLLASENGTITVWDVGASRLVFSAEPDWAFGVAWSPDNRWLASGGNEVRLWNTTTWKPGMDLSGAGGHISWSPDGKRLATGSQYGGIIIWELGSNKPMATFNDPEGRNMYNDPGTDWEPLAWSPDGKQILLIGT
jgi:WD40 repeat protein